MTDGDRPNDMLVQVRAYVVRASADGPYPQGRPREFLRYGSAGDAGSRNGQSIRRVLPEPLL
jgi:hypothetical protein